MTPAQRRAQQAAHERGAFQLSLLVAGLLHVGLAWSLHAPPATPRALRVTEIDITPEPPPAPAPPPPQPPEPPAAAAPEPKPRPVRAQVRRTPPAPARAGAVLTAPEPQEAPAAEEPVRFVSDPAGRGFGYGLVARGGSAEHGETGARAAPPAPVVPDRERIVPSDRLARQPTLLDADCRGYFPQTSTHDLGLVSVVALVQPSGAIARLEIESETPIGQGFARAARACLQRQRFSPALDRHGQPALARTRVSIRFAR